MKYFNEWHQILVLEIVYLKYEPSSEDEIFNLLVCIPNSSKTALNILLESSRSNAKSQQPRYFICGDPSFFEIYRIKSTALQ